MVSLAEKLKEADIQVLSKAVEETIEYKLSWKG